MKKNGKLQTLKLSLGRRINKWLSEPWGETFKDGKWRFWFPMLIGFGLLNAGLTTMVFGSGGNLQTYMGAVMLSVGVLLAWLCVGTLHYSDSRDPKLARGVSALDSITLVCVVAHFCFLLWMQGHLSVLQSQDAKYEAGAAAYNEKAEKISSDNVRIAEAGARTAAEIAKAERLKNDTAYQERRAAESGNARQPRAGRKDQSSAPAMPAVSPIQLEQPEKPKETAVQFLTYWDFWVRLAHFGELALVAITLIYIRNRSAKINSEINATTTTTDATTTADAATTTTDATTTADAAATTTDATTTADAAATTKPASKPRAVRQGSKPPAQKSSIKRRCRM